ncbi:flagellar motor protein MotB [Rhodoplanes sp. TEM]|uniref:Flagellar motor protein MotB n=1 Tax=Rhodoplanes tepidamans TaxID=200616 RepID=A0ABT5J5G4_RHOTP|nr:MULTISPECIES: flagellar motor protein MotB [Rhodoplanes]MDC7784891.1 flagellar motor protein MotB [Rhodoplanes tepidamans]MDC7984013.1 flagellar motor protein MotB [Rhodoplanes sp. TEM]MDQ0353880.1 chemotaxis protein MotB [Rhodoplanes tepidamans]
MARRKVGGHGHGWFVTFADLMALLVAFFVMLCAFSTQDQQKLQVVAGSMRDAFGVQANIRYSGIIEVPGLPTRPKLKNAARIPPEEASTSPTPDQHDRNRTAGVRQAQDRAFALAAASLRQALQDMPELTEVSKHIMIEETREGLNVEIVDQDGRSMFPEGSGEPYERTRRLIERISVPLRASPFRLSITGHTAASRAVARPGYGPWELSSERANAVRRILEAEGVPGTAFFGVTGKADVQPLFPEDPYVAANRRVTISLIREEPPLPLELKH